MGEQKRCKSERETVSLMWEREGVGFKFRKRVSVREWERRNCVRVSEEKWDSERGEAVWEWKLEIEQAYGREWLRERGTRKENREREWYWESVRKKQRNKERESEKERE